MTDSVKIEGLLGMLTVKLQDDNFVKWSYQFQSVLRGYDLFDHFTGESPCPPRFVIDTEAGVTNEITVANKTWVKKDLALLSLLIATLSDDAMEYVIDSKTSHEAWTCLHDRFASIYVVRVNQFKIEFYSSQKGGESVEKFMLKLKGIKDQLISAGEKITDNDYMIVVLSGLRVDFEVIKTIILARETSMCLKDFRAQLLGAEASIETRMHSLSSSMVAMVVHGEGSHSQRFQGGYEHGESSNSNVPGGSGYVGTADRSFQQRNNGQNNYSRRFNNGNNNSKFYSGSYGNRNGNSYDGNGSNTYSGNGKQSQNGNSWNTRTNNWNGNTNYKSSISPECQICSRRGHTALNCYYKADNSNTQPPGGFIVCQICGKRGHIALECYHRNNFSYQGAPPSSSLTAMTAQGHIGQQNASASSTAHDFLVADTWIVDTGATHHMIANMNSMNQATPYTGNDKIVVGNGEGQGHKGDSIPRKE